MKSWLVILFSILAFIPEIRVEGVLTQLLRTNGAAVERHHEQLGDGYDAAGNLRFRTNNAASSDRLVQTFSVDGRNRLTTAARSGKLTVAGAVSKSVSSVTVKDNANPAVGAAVYADKSYARPNVTALNGANTFTAVATDSGGLKDTNTVSVNLPNTVNFTYDANGSMTGDGRRVLFYDDENQLTRVTVANVSSSGFVYDGFGRMRIRYESNWTGSAWVKASEIRYVYDGKLPIQERDANNNVLVTYTRGRDLSGTLEGAGGIGGLLARSQPSHPTAPHVFYHADGGGNVTALINQNQQVVARYNYSPFGSIINQSGYLADANTYRFSSKEYHSTSGLSYYLRRFYDPSLQRWLNEDPVGEQFDRNLYRFVYNNPNSFVDPDGLTGWALTGPQGYWDADYRNLVNSPEYQEGFREGMGQGAVAGTALACGVGAAVYGGPAYVAAAPAALTAAKGMANKFGRALSNIGRKLGRSLRGGGGGNGASAVNAADKFSRTPKSLMDEKVLNAAKQGKGQKIIENLRDPKFKGMEKWSYGETSANGLRSEVHYVRDPKTCKLTDFKFKHHAETYK